MISDASTAEERFIRILHWLFIKKPCGNLSYRYNRKQKDRQRRTEKSLKEDNQSGVFGCWRKYLRKLGFCFCCARQNKIPEKYRYSKSLDRTTPKSGSHKEMKELAIKMIRFYQRKISPLFPPRCRRCPWRVPSGCADRCASRRPARNMPLRLLRDSVSFAAVYSQYGVF